MTLLLTRPAMLVLIAALATGGPVSAQDTAPATPAAEPPAAPLLEMAEIERAWQRGDFVTVREGLKRLAEETGTPLAQYRYGRVLLEGRGGPQDVAGARDWLERAVAQNHAQAATLLARVYLSYRDLHDPERAARLFSNAAARGEVEAQYYLGLMYREGVGLAADPVQAFNWFTAAAEADHPGAQFALSRALSRGEGTAMNTAEALRVLARAADAGHAEAQFFLALALQRGTGIQPNPAQALDWYRRSAEGGFVLAQRRLGMMYRTGEGVAADPAEALRWLAAAAAANDPVAAVVLGIAEATGEGVPQNRAQGLERLRTASQNGVAEASVALGKLFQTGAAGPADVAQAVAFYRRAVEQGSGQAAGLLGGLAGAGQLDGLAPPHLAVPWAMAAAEAGDAAALAWVEARAADGLRPAQSALGRYLLDDADRAAEAIGLLAAAATGDDPPAQYALGLALITGTGTAQDYIEAHKWLNIAAGLGHPEAAAKRDLVADLMSPGEVAEAQARTRAHFDSAASRLPSAAGGAGE